LIINYINTLNTFRSGLKIKVFINKLKEDKKNLIKQKDEITELIRDLRQEITEISGKISELQSKIDGFIFPNRKYLLYHAKYTKGWYMAINNEQTINEKENLLKKCDEVSTKHLIKHGVSDEESEYLIYNVNSTDL
jgi:hypothetical protein